MKTILFYVKDVYGKSTRYYADPNQASYFLMLTGKKTIPDMQYQTLLKLGYTLQEITRADHRHPDNLLKEETVNV